MNQISLKRLTELVPIVPVPVALANAYGGVGIADANVRKTGISSGSPVFSAVFVPVGSAGAAVVVMEVLPYGAEVVGVDVRIPAYRMVVNLSFLVERMRPVEVALAEGVVPTEDKASLTDSMCSVTIAM